MAGCYIAPPYTLDMSPCQDKTKQKKNITQLRRRRIRIFRHRCHPDVRLWGGYLIPMWIGSVDLCQSLVVEKARWCPDLGLPGGKRLL